MLHQLSLLKSKNIWSKKSDSLIEDHFAARMVQRLLFALLILSSALVLSSAEGFSQSNIYSPEEIINSNDNCGLNVLDMAYLAIYPSAKIEVLPRQTAFEKYGALHSFSMAELQDIFAQFKVKSHAYRLESIEDLSELLNSGKTTILHEQRGDVGHFFVCRSDGNGGVEVFDYPEPKFVSNLNSSFFKKKSISSIVLACERMDAKDPGLTLEACPKNGIVNLAPKVEDQEKFASSGGFHFRSQALAKPSTVEPGKLVAVTEIKRLEDSEDFRIVDVKGACSCFQTFSVEKSEDAKSLLVTTVFDRFRFDPMSGTSIAIVVESAKQNVILQAKVDSGFSGKIGELFVLPDVIRFNSHKADAFSAEIAIYIPEDQNSALQEKPV